MQEPENNFNLGLGIGDMQQKSAAKSISEKMKTLHDYIIFKLDEGDYHAVSDAANDLRVLECARNFVSPKISQPMQEFSDVSLR